MDLLRPGSEPRTRRHGRVARSPLGRIAGATDEAARRRQFLAPLDAARCSTWRARRTGRGHGCGRSMSRARSTRRVTSGLEQYTSVSASRDGRRIVATVANPSASLWRVPLLDRHRRRTRRTALPAADRRGRWPRASAGRRCSICPPAERATGCGRSRTERRRKSGRARTGRCPSRPRCRRTDAAWPSSSDKRGNGTCRSCRRTARTHERWPPSIDIQGAAGQGAADWSPDGNVDRRPAAATRRVRRCSRSPWTAVLPVRLVEGQAVNPVWSPDGNLIVYAGRSRRRPGRAPWRATGWHARRAAARARPPGRLSLPARRHGPACTCRAFSRWTSGCSISPRRNRVSSPVSAIRAASDVRYHARRQAHRVRPLAARTRISS